MGQGRRLGVLLLAAAGLVTGCRQQTSLTPEQQLGQKLYQARCAHCHEENDLALRPPPPPLSGLFDRTFLPSGARSTDHQVGWTVLRGKGKMPSFEGRFDDAQLAALIAFLHTGLH